MGQNVLLKTHALNNVAKGITPKCIPKQDGPYIVSRIVSLSSYELNTLEDSRKDIGKFHVSDLFPY